MLLGELPCLSALLAVIEHQHHRRASSSTYRALRSGQGGHLTPAQPFHPLIQVNAPKKCCAYPHCITTLQTVLPGDVLVPADLILASAAVATIKFLVSSY